MPQPDYLSTFVGRPTSDPGSTAWQNAPSVTVDLSPQADSIGAPVELEGRTGRWPAWPQQLLAGHEHEVHHW